MEIQRLGNLKTALGECPVWRGGQLWLLDCRAGLVLALDAGTGAVLARHEVPPPLGAFAFNADGRIVLALKEQISALDPRTGQLRTLARIEASHEHLRLNDGIRLDARGDDRVEAVAPLSRGADVLGHGDHHPRRDGRVR